MRRKNDWATERAREIVDLTSGGLARDASINYVATELRLAMQRGVLGAAKTVETPSRPRTVKPDKATVDNDLLKASGQA